MIGVSWRLAAALLLAALLLGPAAAAPVAMAGPPVPEGERAQAADLYLSRGDLKTALAAARAYGHILEEQPADLEAGLRAVYLLVWVGANHDDEAEAEYNRQALAVAQKVVERHPEDPGAQYWLGVCYGLVAMKAGPFSALEMADKVEAQMKKVLELDPTYDFGGPWRVLGRLYDKLPMLLGGDDDKAEAMFAKALDVAPLYPLTNLYLADLRAKQGKDEEVRRLLVNVQNSPDVPGREPECQAWRAVAARWLATPQFAEAR